MTCAPLPAEALEAVRAALEAQRAERRPGRVVLTWHLGPDGASGTLVLQTAQRQRSWIVAPLTTVLS